ncbi:unnamed protein product [Acanthoscelides obtectus]|uniref:Integrin alpha-PS2 n=1 Tax=Acanthoscelides obtectus TaxID=200917 RepID=A0A9P0LXW1_ACAOB|nr:unnamed protein product [Acanthoscelides obtectus]CAK1655697.1 Integrin alpha-PS2 [Acanthoscelides obtectus]
MVYRGGAVYRCSARGDSSCEEVPFDRQNNAYYRDSMLDDKSQRWLGATLSSSGVTDGPVVACAPRYIWFTKDLNRRDPVGTCFVSNGAFNSFEEYSPCRTMNWGYHRQGSCQAGFSAGINKKGDRLYVGAPGSYYWQGSVHQQSLETRSAVFSTREGSAPDDDSYIGYSTVVGHFRKGEVYEGIAVGMPRGNKLRGKILLFSWDLKNYKNITISEQIGSYFGYCLSTADVNGDGFVDIIVGAPMHTVPNNEGKYDVGRVYVLYQSSNLFESFDISHHIDGINTRGRFGLSVAGLGDLNQDGFDDFAVGAPYDGPNGNGAVYIYYGSKDGVHKKFGQVIYAEVIQTGSRYLSTFGFSIAGGLDLDGNEYPDMAVGAYLSDSAFFFRARPVVKVDGFVRFQTANKQIDIKEKNCRLSNGQDATCTMIDFCIKYSGKGIPDQIDLLVQYILDTKKENTPRMAFFDRPRQSSFNETLRLYKDNRDFCKSQKVYVKADLRDKLTPLEAEVKYFMAEEVYAGAYQQTRDPKSILRPVIDLNNPPSKKDSVSIQKNCGPDNICIPNLHVNVTSNVEKYYLGSDKDLEFDVIVSNFGEDAFETTLELKYPERTYYKKFETRKHMPGISCSPGKNRTVICDVGNPLPSGKIAIFKLVVQPGKAEGMAPTYEFDVFVNSTNPEPANTLRDNHQHLSIGIWINATLDIRGESYPSTVYYNESLYTSQNITREIEIGPEVTHVYYLTNRGPATVQEAEVFILWPFETLGGDDLLYLLDQPHTQGNLKCDFVPAVNYRQYYLDYIRAREVWDRLKIDISGIEQFWSAEKQTSEFGRGVSSGVGVINKNVGGVPTGDSSGIFEVRHNQTSSFSSSGRINPRGEIETTESRLITTYRDGVPYSRWENRTTIKDAHGNVLRTFMNYDNTDYLHSGSRIDQGGPMVNLGTINAAGEYVLVESQYNTRWVDGKPVTEWHNVTTVRDHQGNVIRTYTSDSDDAVTYGSTLRPAYSSTADIERRRQEEERFNEQQERLRIENERQEVLRRQELHRKQQQQEEDQRIRLEESRRRQEKEEEERRRLESSRGIHVAQEERRLREEALRRQKDEEEQRRLREEMLRRQKEEEEQRRLREETLRKQKDEQEQRRLREEALKRQQLEEERRRYEEEARRRHQSTVSQTWRQTEDERRIYEESRRQPSKFGVKTSWQTEDERNAYEEEVKRRQQSGVSATEKTEEESIRQEEDDERRRQYEEAMRKYYEEVRRREEETRAREEHAYEVGGGPREGGISATTASSRHYAAGSTASGGYYDEQGVWRRYPAGAHHVSFNKTYSYESSTTIPIDLAVGGGRAGGFHAGLGEMAAGSGFTIQTLDLGAGGYGAGVTESYGAAHSGSVSSSSAGSHGAAAHGGHTGGGYRREWKAEGGYSSSGSIPPVYHNRVDRDNVPPNSDDSSGEKFRVRGRRQVENDPYEEMRKMLQCNSTRCVYMRCTVGTLAKDKEIAIALRSRLNVRAVKNLTTEQGIKISSMMVARISKLPYIGEKTDEFRSHEIFTEIPAQETELVPEVAPMWIYIISAIAGVVMLLLLIWLLSKCGFFKRNRPSSAPERQPLNRNGYHSGDEAL